MAFNVLTVQEALRNIHQQHGVDILSRPGMAEIAGKHYGHVAPILHVSTTPKGYRNASLVVLVPHENTYVSRFDAFHDDKPGTGPGYLMQNMLVPGSQKLSSGKVVQSLEYPDEDRIGPFNYDSSGNIRHEEQRLLSRRNYEQKFKNIHGLIQHVNTLPRPQGQQDSAFFREHNKSIPISDLKNFNLRDALEHHIRHETNADMTPKSENLLHVVHYSYKVDDPAMSGEDFLGRQTYLYSPHTERLTPVPRTSAETY